MTHVDLLIAGAGLAAASLIDELRDRGDDRSVLLVGDEGERPYERPPLSKEVLLGQEPVESAYVHDLAHYETHGVQTTLSDAVAGIAPDSRRIQLASGTEVGYTDLVLATGATPRRLPIDGMDLPGVHTLRRIGDAEAIKATFGEGRRLVVIGAGWIGLEVAAAARQAGTQVTVLEAADVPLQATMGAELGSYFARLHTSRGVDLRTGTAATAIEGADRVTGVQVDGKTLPADTVLVAVGAAPNTGLAESAELDVENGILVDERLRAADHIYAIGDVAHAVNTALGQRVRVEHWDNAIRQGKLAAKVLIGTDEVYDWQPYFFTDQYDLGMEYVGRGLPEDRVVIRGELESGEFLAFWLRSGVLTAAMNVNIWDVSDQLRAHIGREIAPERLADEAVPLADL
ncbi:NAD(P)/FAD-dependent oxidoreductase [Ruania zhangjianzhongii]|uniref:NAD(P)/FAD-dependent oxidoreductase n=1 Tax=Ruania zhangjianzhongii TaxID=2603206 RepID=UPI0011CC016D|nr:FAD-dependent oxidoreductase [Ruania zhangjianzhongii]